MMRTVNVRRRPDWEREREFVPVGIPYRAESHPEDLEREQAEQRARAKLGFYAHAGAYLIVMGLLVAINLVNTPDRLWFVWPLVGWGVAVVAHAVGVFALGEGGWASRYLIDRELRRG